MKVRVHYTFTDCPFYIPFRDVWHVLLIWGFNEEPNVVINHTVSHTSYHTGTCCLITLGICISGWLGVGSRTKRISWDSPGTPLWDHSRLHHARNFQRSGCHHYSRDYRKLNRLFCQLFRGIESAKEDTHQNNLMHVHFLDPFINRSSLIHQLDPRIKLILTISFILVISLIPVGIWDV